MNIKLAGLVALIIVLAAGCQNLAPTNVTPTSTHVPTLTLTAIPTTPPEPAIPQPCLISKGILSCTPIGTFARCVDDVLDIEFEYPSIWGEIEAELRTGGYSGYAYDYYFDGKTIAETEPLVAGGRSVDFSEGRGAMPTDFAGYGDAGLQIKQSCDASWQDVYP